MTSRRKLGVGVVGVGGIAKRHIQAFVENDRTHVAALCDPNTSRAKAASENLGDVPLFQDFEDLLSAKGVDIVAICSPSALHAAQLKSAVSAGKPVFVEKPVVVTPEELADVHRVLGDDAPPCAGGMILRFHPLMTELRHLLSIDALGDINVASAGYISHLDPALPNYSWMRSKAAGSAMLGGGSHIVDLLRWLIQDRVCEVSAAGIEANDEGYEFAPTVTGSLRFAQGATAALVVTLVSPIRYLLTLGLVGTKALFRDGRLYREEPNGDGHVHDMEPGMPKIPIPQALFDAQIADFVDAIVMSRAPRADLRDVLASHAVCLALDESQELGRPVRIA